MEVMYGSPYRYFSVMMVAHYNNRTTEACEVENDNIRQRVDDKTSLVHTVNDYIL